MRGIVKRRRYADVYDEAFAGRTDLAAYVASVLRDFEASPMAHARAPRYLCTLLRSQSIARDARLSVSPRALALSRWVEERAARLIARRVLLHLYKPGGWFATMRHPGFAVLGGHNDRRL